MCPCGSKLNAADCCQPYLQGLKLPLTPETLMRSRYTAYTQANIAYIQATMCKNAAQGFDAVNAYSWAKSVQWKRLHVIKSSQQGDQGKVEFKAYFEQNEEQHILHEISIFERIDGKWFYVDGTMPK